MNAVWAVAFIFSEVELENKAKYIVGTVVNTLVGQQETVRLELATATHSLKDLVSEMTSTIKAQLKWSLGLYCKGSRRLCRE